MEIGTYLPADGGAAELVADGPEAAESVDRPWGRAWIAARTGLALRSPKAAGGAACIPEEAWRRHGICYGLTGTGKTRLLAHTVLSHLDQGGSAVLLAPKGEEYDFLLSHVAERGWPAERTILIDPRDPWTVPFNPLLGDLPLERAVGDFLALFERLYQGGLGYRLLNILTHGLFLVGSLGLSLVELVRLLTDDPFREDLLRLPPKQGGLAYRVAVAFFLYEYGRWTPSQRLEAAGALTNKLSGILRSRFLRPLLCSSAPPFDLARLGQEPCLLLVRLGLASLAPEEGRLLAGLLTYGLLRTALRTPGPVPVLLAVDELPQLERFVGEPIAQLLALARSQNLRFLGAAQHSTQLSDGLRAALSGAAVQLAFRLNPADARQTAAIFAGGAEERLARALVGTERRGAGGQLEECEWRHPIRDADGRPLRVDASTWREFERERLFAADEAALLARLAGGTARRLYVQSADTGEPAALRRYLEGLPGSAYTIAGPVLQLVVRFPKPRLTGVERWTEADAAREWARRLQELPTRHAALRILGGPAGVVRIRDVPDPQVAPEALERFIRASREAHAQSPAEIARQEAERQARNDQIAAGAASAAGSRADGIPAHRRSRSAFSGPLLLEPGDAGACAGALGNQVPDAEEDDGSIA